MNAHYREVIITLSVFAIVAGVLLALTSCATVSSDVDKCLAFGGSPSYTTTGSSSKFECRI